jgi:hypothetical protein
LAILTAQNALARGSAPMNFAVVDAHLMRGGEVTEPNVEWLADHGVKAIVKLDDENPAEYMWEVPVQSYHINKFGFNLSFAFVKNILAQIDSDAKYGAVYVHCEHGADRTGLIVALYRVARGWSIDDARAEMNDPKFGHSSLQIWIDHKFEVYAQRLVDERGND